MTSPRSLPATDAPDANATALAPPVIAQAPPAVAQARRNEALGRITGNVAHEFNNLLGVVSNCTHLIRRDADGRFEPLLATLQRAVDNGQRLTQQLLQLAGRPLLQPQLLDLYGWLASVPELMRAVLGRRVQLQLRVAHDLRQVRIDAAELELAFVNLALNAREALPEGGQVVVNASNAGGDEVPGVATSGEYQVLITVSVAAGADRQLDAVQGERTAGSARGLEQVAAFCAQAGGRLWQHSLPRGASAVSMLLPAQAGPARTALPASSPVPTASAAQSVPGASGASTAPAVSMTPPASAAPALLRGLRLLLVEDNDDLARVTVALLEGQGLLVQRVDHAAAALRALNSAPQPFDVLLSDVRMPGGMDGLSLARTVRARWPALPLLLISGDPGTAPGAAGSAEAEGFELLAKPCPPPLLMAALERVVQRVVQAAPRTAPSGIAGAAPGLRPDLP